MKCQLNSGLITGILHLIHLHLSNTLCYSFSAEDSHVDKIPFDPNCPNEHLEYYILFLGAAKQMTATRVV